MQCELKPTKSKELIQKLCVNACNLLTEKRAYIVGWFLLHVDRRQLSVVNVDRQKVITEQENTTNIPKTPRLYYTQSY